MKKENYIVVFVTAASLKEAKKIADALLGNRLAACVNIINPVNSIFVWKGKIDKAKEALLVIKTTARCFNRLKILVKDIHSYQVPEIIALPITAGDKKYLGWIDKSTQ